MLVGSENPKVNAIERVSEPSAKSWELAAVFRGEL
jgi:hypothetical protein